MDLPTAFIISFVILIASQNQVLASKPKPKPAAKPTAKPSSTGIKPSSTDIKPSSTDIKPSSTGSRPSAHDGSASESSNFPDRNPISTGDDADPRQSVPGKKTSSTADDADLLGEGENSPISSVGGSGDPYARPNTAAGGQVNTAFNPDNGDPWRTDNRPGVTLRPSATTRKPAVVTEGHTTPTSWHLTSYTTKRPMADGNRLKFEEGNAGSADEAPMKGKLREDQEDDKKKPDRNGSTLPASSCALTAAAMGVINMVLWRTFQ